MVHHHPYINSRGLWQRLWPTGFFPTTTECFSHFGAKEIRVKVFYEEGAQPYTEGIGEIKIWNLLELNLKALFEGRHITVNVPKELSEMTKLVGQEKMSWTPTQVLELDQNTSLPAPVGSNTFHIYFLKGRAAENAHIIGYHITGSKVLVVFKDVITSMGLGLDQLVPRYVEQATLVHEMGHAIGLVNNGLPMVSPHQDHAHGAHCDNPNCVMYYSNEGSSSMLKFANKIISEMSVIMFGPKCLNDARSFQSK